VASHLSGQSLAGILLSLSLCCESIRLSLNCTKGVWINEVRYGNILQCVSTVTPIPHCILCKLWYRVLAHQPKTTPRLLWIIICSTSIQMNIKQWNWQQKVRGCSAWCCRILYYWHCLYIRLIGRISHITWTYWRPQCWTMPVRGGNPSKNF